ncbi:MAG: hypothetical protein KF809_13615 [Chloroflexi bacterium]|nr:hypothetical protein [Chloroflexota bacterium]
MKRILALASTVVLSGAAQLATAPPAEAASVAKITVTVKCKSNPETLTITNKRSGSITVTKVGSTYQPRSGEPYFVYKTLAPGKSITYRFGTKRGANKLTNQFIFNDTSSREKAKVWISGRGTITRKC